MKGCEKKKRFERSCFCGNKHLRGEEGKLGWGSVGVGNMRCTRSKDEVYEEQNIKKRVRECCVFPVDLNNREGNLG